MVWEVFQPPDGRLSPLRKAKLLLKKKRYLETLLTRTDTQLDNMQQMVDNIEFTQIEMKVVEGLKQGNECLEAMHKVCSSSTLASSLVLDLSSFYPRLYAVAFGAVAWE